MQAAFDAGRRFFALPEDSKARWHIDRWPLRRGFDPVGWQSLDPAQPPDLKESFYLGVESHRPEPVARGRRLPGPQALEAYSAAMDALARRLMGLFEQALGLAGRPLRPSCATPPAPRGCCTTRRTRPGGAARQIGCGAHTDWGALTLLAQDDAGGLQVQRGDAETASWLDVTPIPGSFVVNAGDMTQRFTNDRWRSTVHRVVQGRERWSIAYFFDLDAEASVEPLACCTSADDPPRYGALTAGEHLEAMYRQTTVGCMNA